MPRTQIPAAGEALPALGRKPKKWLSRQDRANCGQIPQYLSTLIADPFVRRAFERAEREDGTAPALMPAEPRKPLQGGAEARRELVDA
jgi:hypothetical protein